MLRTAHNPLNDVAHAFRLEDSLEENNVPNLVFPFRWVTSKKDVRRYIPV